MEMTRPLADAAASIKFTCARRAGQLPQQPPLTTSVGIRLRTIIIKWLFNDQIGRAT